MTLSQLKLYTIESKRAIFRYFIQLVILFSIYALFRKSIDETFASIGTIIANSPNMNSTLGILFLFYSLSAFIRLIKYRVVIDSVILKWFIFPIVVWLTINLISPNLIFTKIEHWSVKMRIDYMLMTCALSELTLFVIYWLSTKKINNNSVHTDQLDHEDKFELQDDAKALCAEIDSITPQNEAINFGICGEWGSGKTTFMQYMQQHIKRNQKDVIIINFNPWKSNSPNQIVQDFFNTLAEAIPYIDFTGAISRYGKALTAIVRTNWMAAITSALSGNSSIEKSHKRLKRIIRLLNRKIVIFVDDIDRMDGKEIMAVFKLLRNTADFPNMIYVVAYDKGHVQQQISRQWQYEQDDTSNSAESKSELFLNKIIQMEYQISPEMDDRPINWLWEKFIVRVKANNQECSYKLDELQKHFEKRPIKTFRTARRIYSLFILKNNFYKDAPLDEVFLLSLIDFFSNEHDLVTLFKLFFQEITPENKIHRGRIDAEILNLLKFYFNNLNQRSNAFKCILKEIKEVDVISQLSNIIRNSDAHPKVSQLEKDGLRQKNSS